MLKVMRESFHQLKWILLAVVAAFVFGFVFLDMGLGGAFGKKGTQDRAFAARVNGETITYNEYYRSLKNYEDMYRQMYGQQFTPEMAAAMGLQKQVLEALIDQRLMGQEADRLHMSATPEEVRKKLLTIPTFSDNGKFVGMELYTRYVTGPLGYPSAAAFEDELAREIELQKIESALQSSVVVSPKAAEAEYKRMNENAKIRYVVLPAAQAAATVNVTPAEVESYYRNNQSKYTHGEQRQIRYLLADYTKIRSTISPTEQDLRKQYETNKNQYKSPAAAHVLHILVKVDPAATPQADAAARAKALSLVQQLRAGADFATLARANSEDPSSSGNGGDMGWVEQGQTVEPFDKAILTIPLNTISDPIRSQEYGYHIVKVVERRPESFRSFEEVRPELTLRAATDMAKEQAKVEINRINSIVKNNKPKDLNAFVALANDKVTSNDSGWFAQTDPIQGIGPHQPLSQWVFSAKKGDISAPIGTPRGIAIAYVADVRPAGVSTLADVRQKVEQDLRQQKAREAARTMLQQMMAGAATLDQIAAKIGAPAREASVNRQNGVTGLQGDATQLIDAAIGAEVGPIKGPITVAEGAVAFQVLEQTKVSPEELKQKREAYMETLRTQQARTLRAALIQRLRKHARIEVNDEITRPTTTPSDI